MDFPHPDYPTNAENLLFISKVKLDMIFFYLSLGYAKLTFSNLNTPLKVEGVTSFSGDFTNGSLSIILKILTAATLPYDIFLIDGVSWLKLKPAIRILKKTIKTSPGLYFSSPFKWEGQTSVSSVQWEPYQKPNEYDAKIEKKSRPIPMPRKAPYFVDFLVISFKV